MLLSVFSYRRSHLLFPFFFLNDPPPPEISTLPLHAALPIGLAELSLCLVLLTTGTAVRVLFRRWRPCGLRRHAHSTRWNERRCCLACTKNASKIARQPLRSEEHTAELQSRLQLVCRLLPRKK